MIELAADLRRSCYFNRQRTRALTLAPLSNPIARMAWSAARHVFLWRARNWRIRDTIVDQHSLEEMRNQVDILVVAVRVFRMTIANKNITTTKVLPACNGGN